MAEPGALIAIDWGTSAFRAALLDRAGAVLARRDGPHGIMNVRDGAFAAVLQAQVGDWLAARQLPVLMSGMIGSRQGWVEAPYVTCPAGLDDLAAGLIAVPFEAAEVRIVPGVEVAAAMMRDVMRGEETQVFGALARSGTTAGRFILPGTHSKWVVAEAGRIIGFATYMTGELYAACREHTILGRLMRGSAPDRATFLRGVTDGARAGGPGALLNRLFGVRTAGLFGEIPEAGLADYLSGLLIGAEVAEAGAGSGPLGIIGEPELAERYAEAAGQLDMEASILPADLAVSGQFAIAEKADLMAGIG